MQEFESYVRKLEIFTSKLLTLNPQHHHVDIGEALDGQPSKVLRSSVSISELRKFGAFFTPRNLANQLVKSIVPDIKKGAILFDPCCGVGDLLIACARHLPITVNLGSTLKIWSNRLKGYDLYPQFIRAAKVRLVLLALAKGTHPDSYILKFEDYFPNIKVQDSLTSTDTLPKANCIVVNPPYSMVPAPVDCAWASGSVSQAALFLEKCIKDAMPETKIVAILPDVLRTGSRYLKWRDHIENFARLDSVEIIGQFDPLTDIDVFIARFTLIEEEAVKQDRDWWSSNRNSEASTKKIEDCFEVRVGPVVPHRHPLEGPSYPYIDAHHLPTWEIIEANFAFRKFSGTTFLPPFVAVRRTSRPGDQYRAVGTIITGTRPVAVENHLIVLKPKTNALDDCIRLLDNLRSSKTNDWLNERIRCRHLTVSALRTLPWWTQ